MAIAALKELLARGLIQNDSRLPPRTSRSLRARLRCRKPAAPGWKNHVRYKTPRVHLAARQRGGVAAPGSRSNRRSCTPRPPCGCAVQAKLPQQTATPALPDLRRLVSRAARLLSTCASIFFEYSQHSQVTRSISFAASRRTRLTRRTPRRRSRTRIALSPTEHGRPRSKADNEGNAIEACSDRPAA